MNNKEQPALVFRSGIISLWDVKTYLAPRLISITNCIILLDDGIGDEEQWKTNPEIRNGVLQKLKTIESESEALELKMTAIYARRIAAEAGQITALKLKGMAVHLVDRFDDELAGVQFFSVKPERLKFYENTTLAGEDFKRVFPRANVELIEAGNCFALDRYTACVFHLMRALEIALVALESKLGIPRPVDGPDKTWGRTLGRIRGKITDDKNPPLPNWTDNKPFYDKAYGFLAAIKVPLRDDTMHVESTYNEESADGVFQVVTVALRHFSAKLSE